MHTSDATNVKATTIETDSYTPLLDLDREKTFYSNYIKVKFIASLSGTVRVSSVVDSIVIKLIDVEVM